MSQVSCGKFRLGAPVVHRVFKLGEGAPEGRVVTDRVGHDQGQAGTEQASVHPGEEEGEA